MKKNNFKNGLLAVLVLSSGIVCADDQYPAADFQPTVVYQDESYIANNSKAAASSQSAPAAKAQSSAADAKYPAANFEPQVVYSDPDYKPSAVSAGSSSSASSNASSATASAAPDAAAAPADTLTSYCIGLIVMALGGVAFFRSRNCGKCTKSAKTSASSSSAGNSNSGGGLTGVAKYLSRASGTGVSRYLDKHVQSVKASAATGVEKYIRNRR
ncbi:conserved exported hypothetical protein [Crenothrix polyspora]|uniref:Uncharacterized protein n=1 Tax=Crenothrix polyspora TaxID=360316 RepID=A0A1R4H2E9_9GAMM|nr:hypothetical protein [Crenothrix polyspora]SJM90411.1 conserved exported hypothetical protein [Crenothrix polyspora]